MIFWDYGDIIIIIVIVVAMHDKNQSIKINNKQINKNKKRLTAGTVKDSFRTLAVPGSVTRVCVRTMDDTFELWIILILIILLLLL